MKRLITRSAEASPAGRSRPPRSPLQAMADRAPASLRLAALQAEADSSPRVLQARRAGDPRQAVQRQAEEEEPLQGKLAQRQAEEEGAQAEEEEPVQGKLVQRQAEEEEPLQGKAVQREEAPNRTGMPDALKSGIESLSGMDMSEVRVHGGSAKPAAVGALAYAQGNDIHLGPGQERHLAHEAWHVVQQRQGRVRPTTQAKGVAINDDPALEQEADAMGAKALQRRAAPGRALEGGTRTAGPVQREGGAYRKVEKEDPDSAAYRDLGKDIVAVYRSIGQASEQLKKGKNREALKLCAIGLADAGVKIGTAFLGVPGLIGVDAGGIATSLTVESAAVKGTTTATGLGLGAAEPGALRSVERNREAMTVAGMIKQKIDDKVGSLRAVATTAFEAVPGVTAAKRIGKGAMLAAQSRDDFNKGKGVLIRSMQGVIAATDEAIAAIDSDFDDVTITSTGKKLSFLTTKRSLKEVCDKYKAKCAELIEVATAFEEKHQLNMPLLADAASSDAD